MIVIHQAIYGEVLGKTSGHDLLAGSDEKKELFRRVSGYTDLADRPEGGVLSGPVVRGFFAEGHFLLIKTFPDKSPGLRSGRVFSHALFISKPDLHRVHNLSRLFQYHLSDIQKEAKMHSLEYNFQEAMVPTGALDGREAAATNALLQNQPFVWLGEEGYWEWVTRIWSQLPTSIKHTLKIGAAFGPSYAKNESLNLLYIPENAKTLWERHEYRIIDGEETETLESSVGHWLAGNVEEALPFQTLLKDFAPKIDSIDLLNRLQSHGKVYHRLDQKRELRHLLVLSHFISRVNPDEKSGIKGKSRLLSAILETLPEATVQQVMALTDQSWKGFPGAMTSASDAVRDWLTNHLLQGKHAKEGGGVLVKALETENKNWWTKKVLEYVTERLKKRQPSDARVLWQWMKNESALIAKHTFWLPDDAENELTQKIPKLDTAVAEALLHMAEQKGWLMLHAKLAAQCYSAKRAIEAQLCIDTNEYHTVALEALSKSIKESAFVPVAASHTDVRLHRIAGKLISENRKLLKGIDIASEGWQHCWEAAVKEGAEVWSGISDPQQTLFEILDHLLAGNSFSETLLNAISTGKHSSLKDYPERAHIWHELPTKARSGFITATLTELIDELATGQIHYNDLENDLKNGAQSQEVRQQIIGSKTIPLDKKIRLFDVLPGLEEKDAQQLMRGHRFLLIEAERFGRLVSKKQWTVVADMLYAQRIDRRDLIPALLKSYDLLSFKKRLVLSVSRIKPDAISKEEWWNALTQVAFTTYPEGPNEKGLWDRAGGDLSQLYFKGNGREVWVRAIRVIRNQGNPSVENLIAQMLEDHSRHEILLKLKENL